MDCSSLLSGGGIAIFAFCLAWARDSYARRRERARHDEAVIGAIRAETFANRATLENNQRLVERELELLPENERLLNPLDPLQAGFWDLVK